MNPTRVFILSLLLLEGAFGQISQVPYEPFYESTFANTQEHISYRGSYSSIRKVNFQELRLPSPIMKGLIKTLKRGDKHRDPFDHFSIALDAIYYLNDAWALKEGAALVLSSWIDGGGSSSQGGVAQVFTLSDRHLLMIQGISWTPTLMPVSRPSPSMPSRTRL